MEATGEPAQFKSMAYSDPIYGMTSMTEELDDTLVEINKFKKIAQGLRDDFFVEIPAAGIKPVLSFQRPATKLTVNCPGFLGGCLV